MYVQLQHCPGIQAIVHNMNTLYQLGSTGSVAYALCWYGLSTTPALLVSMRSADFCSAPDFRRWFRI
jgi:hypothetical protein